MMQLMQSHLDAFTTSTRSYDEYLMITTPQHNDTLTIASSLIIMEPLRAFPVCYSLFKFSALACFWDLYSLSQSTLVESIETSCSFVNCVMNFDKDDPKEGSQTCHLCGKVQCGQRLGRVKCCQCNRIFCLQQLSRKFHIIATANDPHFKCPRCTGICCCVCNCQKPPPHVHCKVYKVRQNKLKQASLHDHHYPTDIPKSITPDIPVLAPIVDESPFPNRPYQPEPAPTTQVTRWEGISNTWQDPQALWQLPNLDVSGSGCTDAV